MAKNRLAWMWHRITPLSPYVFRQNSFAVLCNFVDIYMIILYVHTHTSLWLTQIRLNCGRPIDVCVSAYRRRSVAVLTATVTAVFLLRTVLRRGRISKQSSVSIPASVGRLEHKCFQLTTKSSRRPHQLNLTSVY